MPPLQLHPLATVVHRLPQLTSLDIGGAPSDAFLEALDGRAVPRLAELRLNSPVDCHHVWAHSEQVRSLLHRYPQLHVQVNASFSDVFCECDFCLENECHDIDLNSSCTLFAHPTAEHCEWGHEQEVFIGQE